MTFFKRKVNTFTSSEEFIKVNFDPKQDITAFELAYVVSHLVHTPLYSLHTHGLNLTRKQWEDMPPSVARHFYLVSA